MLGWAAAPDLLKRGVSRARARRRGIRSEGRTKSRAGNACLVASRRPRRRVPGLRVIDSESRRRGAERFATSSRGAAPALRLQAAQTRRRSLSLAPGRLQQRHADAGSTAVDRLDEDESTANSRDTSRLATSCDRRRVVHIVRRAARPEAPYDARAAAASFKSPPTLSLACNCCRAQRLNAGPRVCRVRGATANAIARPSVDPLPRGTAHPSTPQRTGAAAAVIGLDSRGVRAGARRHGHAWLSLARAACTVLRGPTP